MSLSVSASSISSLSSLSSTSAVSGATSTAAASDTSAASGADQTKMSKMGQLMSQLQDLEKSDPDKAKAVLSKIADQLKSQASSSGDSKMSALADKFSQAAQTGDLSGLAPKGGGGHHHHHASSSSGGDASSSQSQTSQTQAYQANGGDPMEQVESIISGALQGS